MLPAARTRGINFAVVTLGLGTALELMLFDNGNYTGGIAGTQVGQPERVRMGHQRHRSSLALRHRGRLAVFVGACLLVANVRRGRSGHRHDRGADQRAGRGGARESMSERRSSTPSGCRRPWPPPAASCWLSSNSTITYTNFTNFTSITDVAWAMIGGIGYVVGPVFGSTLADGGVGTQITNTLLSGMEKYITLIGGVIVICSSSRTRTASPRRRAPRCAGCVGRSASEHPSRRPRRAQDRPNCRPSAAPGRRAARSRSSDLTVRYGATTAVDEVSLQHRARTDPGPDRAQRSGQVHLHRRRDRVHPAAAWPAAPRWAADRRPVSRAAVPRAG